MRTIYSGRSGRVAQRLEHSIALVGCRGRWNVGRYLRVFVADFSSDPLVPEGTLEDRKHIVCERRDGRYFVTQAVDSGLQQRVVETDDMEDWRCETGRRTDHPSPAGLNRIFGSLQ